MGYIDRFFIARTLGLDMVAFYVTPYEIITRLWIVPGAVTGVLFPSLVGLRVDNAFSQMFHELMISFFCVLIIVAPIAGILYFYSWELLAWWINPDFANQSSVVVEVLAIGIVLNCITHIPYTLIQSTGNSKSTAIIHLIELPILLISLIPLLESFGILGAAYAWLIRITLDFILMWIVGFGVIKSQRNKIY
jgi:O-antigen/teichoic acid export membrane protein